MKTVIFSASEVTTIWRYTNVYIIIIIIIILVGIRNAYICNKQQPTVDTGLTDADIYVSINRGVDSKIN